jgi:hypothetical protein
LATSGHRLAKPKPQSSSGRMTGTKHIRNPGPSLWREEPKNDPKHFLSRREARCGEADRSQQGWPPGKFPFRHNRFKGQGRFCATRSPRLETKTKRSGDGIRTIVFSGQLPVISNGHPNLRCPLNSNVGIYDQGVATYEWPIKSGRRVV